MQKEISGGVYTALVTPFLENKKIDWDAFETLVQKQIEASITGLIICGTTGESTSLDVHEKLALIKRACALAGGKIKVMAGSGGINTTQTVELSKLCEDAGAGSLLVVTPPYVKANPVGLAQHYRAIKNAITIPICLYHVPSRTSQFLEPDVMVDIMKNEGISCIKEASGNMAYLNRLCAAMPEACILSGDDATYLASMAIGSRGVVSVASNLFPAEMVSIWNHVNQGNLQAAKELNHRLTPFFDAAMLESNPVPIKWAMFQKNLIKNECRLPLWPASETTQKAMKECLSAMDMR